MDLDVSSQCVKTIRVRIVRQNPSDLVTLNESWSPIKPHNDHIRGHKLVITTIYSGCELPENFSSFSNIQQMINDQNYNLEFFQPQR